ncbi:hypothetical protein [Sporosarcina sp.]|nr:hypothetical protein [Sporosarcina sp.]
MKTGTYHIFCSMVVRVTYESSEFSNSIQQKGLPFGSPFPF